MKYAGYLFATIVVFGCCILPFDPFHKPRSRDQIGYSYAYTNGKVLDLFIQVTHFRTRSRPASPPYSRTTKGQSWISVSLGKSPAICERDLELEPSFNDNIGHVVRALGSYYIIGYDEIHSLRESGVEMLSTAEQQNFVSTTGIDFPTCDDDDIAQSLARDDGWLRVHGGGAWEYPNSRDVSKWFELHGASWCLYREMSEAGETLLLESKAGEKIEIFSVQANRKTHIIPGYYLNVAITVIALASLVIWSAWKIYFRFKQGRELSSQHAP